MAIFRYPGGKRRLLPVLDEYLRPLLANADTYHSVFVGGGSDLLHVAEHYPDHKLFANDLDEVKGIDLVPFHPVVDGWWGSRKGTAVRVQLRDGDDVRVGTGRPNELLSALEAARVGHKTAPPTPEREGDAFGR